MSNQKTADLLARLDTLTPQELKRYLVQELTRKKLGLTWEADFIERDAALNSNMVFPELVAQDSLLDASETSGNLIIEGDNFDSLRLLKATHAGKIRVILIDPPYNTGNKDWVYNDNYINKNNRWKHSTWLEFLYCRLTLARDLLTPDGVIIVTINDENRSRLELLMDEVFPGRRLGSLVWRTKDTGNDLTQRFSHVHEHVLVYANAGFHFNGNPTNRKKFTNTDNDPRGDWSPQPLTKAHTYTDRENTYYPIQNPDTGYWYPCDPDSVWRFASEKEISKRFNGDTAAISAALSGLRSDTIEQLISKKLIYFPPCKPSEVMMYESMEDLISAIKSGKGPRLPRKKSPLLRENLPDIEFWVGKPIAPGRPSRKEHWTAKPEGERLAPFSSWIAGIHEDIGDEEDLAEPMYLRTTRGGVATDEIKDILGEKAFSYPKPLSLIQGLLQQASRPGDTILDFFAGSGTTGHAVLALNAEDNGNRKFILCSSTEATPKEPDKNLCLDVCAERIRNVIKGYGKTDGLHGDFAYLKLTLMEEADLPFEATAAHAYITICMRETGHVRLPEADSVVWPVAINVDSAVVMCPTLTDEACAALEALGVRRLVVYTDRPDRLQDMLIGSLLDVTTYSLEDALRRGQGVRLNDDSAALEVEL